MQLIVDGLVTSYERQGRGRTVVLLHGWGDRAASLRGIESLLAADFDVIALDLPGFGATQAPPMSWGLDDYAAFVAEFLRKLEVRHTYAVIGHSNGGAIAIRGLASGVLAPDRLVLLASAGIRGEGGRRRALQYVTKVGKLVSAPLPRGIKQRLRRKVYQAAGSDMFVAEHLQETFRRIIADDVRSDASGIKIPTLLMYGEHDTATPVHHGKLLQALIPGSILEVIPVAGHFVHLDQPAKTGQIVKDFLR